MLRWPKNVRLGDNYQYYGLPMDVGYRGDGFAELVIANNMNRTFTKRGYTLSTDGRIKPQSLSRGELFLWDKSTLQFIGILRYTRHSL